MNKKYNTMVFCVDAYEGDTPECDMEIDIMSFIKILMKNNMVVVVREEERGIVVVEYEHDEKIDAWGDENPYWITEEEWEDIMWNRKEKEKEKEEKERIKNQEGSY